MFAQMTRPVSHGSNGAASPPPFRSAAPRRPIVHRTCAACEAKSSASASPAAQDDDSEAEKLLARTSSKGGCTTCAGKGAVVNRSAAEGAAGEAANAPSLVGDVVGSSGQPLSPAVRSYFEPRFGQNLGDVRVHTGARADASARSVNALAYTVDRDIVFREGSYSPETNPGKKLLAHELVHVLQQSNGAPSRQDKSAGLSVSDPSDAAEIEADTIANEVVGGGVSSPIQRAPMAIARQVPDGDAGAPQDSELHTKQVACVARLGGHPSTRDGGVPSPEDIAGYNEECRRETGYSGPDVTVSDDAARQLRTGEVLDPAKLEELRGLVAEFNELSASGLVTAEDAQIVGAQLAAVGAAMARVGTSPPVPDPSDPQASNDPQEHDKEAPQLAAGGATMALGGMMIRAAPAAGGAAAAGGVAVAELIPPIAILVGVSLVFVAVYTLATGTLHIDLAAGQTLITAVAVIAATVARVRVRRRRNAYSCTAQCQANGGPTGAYFVTGTSSRNCAEATLAAKAAVPRGQYPRHCSCSDTDGFRGTGHQCEAHQR